MSFPAGHLPCRQELNRNDTTTMTPQAAAAKQNEGVPLLTLPAEIREEIWGEVTMDPSTTTNNPPAITLRILPFAKSMTKRPMLVCQQMNQELQPHIVANTGIKLVSAYGREQAETDGTLPDPFSEPIRSSRVISYGEYPGVSCMHVSHHPRRMAVLRHYHRFFLELPGTKVRSCLRSLHIVLPMPGDEFADARVDSKADCLDWLYPVRELKALGFGTLARLVVEVQISADMAQGWSQAYVEDKMAAFAIDAQEVQVRVTVKSTASADYPSRWDHRSYGQLQAQT
ncbi:hypothetical protein LTR85_009026 [Meristemomyces frigidus]|nr:hypothetical protein LTR85_009026 [Meristemomyces frigidus]